MVLGSSHRLELPRVKHTLESSVERLDRQYNGVSSLGVRGSVSIAILVDVHS